MRCTPTASAVSSDGCADEIHVFFFFFLTKFETRLIWCCVFAELGRRAVMFEMGPGDEIACSGRQNCSLYVNRAVFDSKSYGEKGYTFRALESPRIKWKPLVVNGNTLRPSRPSPRVGSPWHLTL